MLDELKQNVPVDLVLDVWGVETAAYWGQSGWRTSACPVHEDEHPSAGVSPGSDYFRCMACGWEGDVIALVQKVEKLSFGEAVRWLQDLAPPSDTTTSL